jgi:ADP-L-glycero-D-manno-heptose 6-epimerase
MKILITGSDGFIGSNLRSELFSDNIVYDLSEDFLQDSEWEDNLIKYLDQILPDSVFHVGACSNTLETDVNYIMTRNYQFTKILVDWCSFKNIPLIYSSSASCYGDNGTCPSNLYGWSKYTAEQYVISNWGIALRYFNVYGSGEEHKGNMASVAYQMLVKNSAGESVKLFKGNPKRDFVYIDDVVSANIYGMNHFFKLNKKFYDVGSGIPESFESVMEILDIPYVYSELDPPKGYQFYTCSNKNSWMPGWKPKYNLEKGLKIYKNKKF